MSAPYKLEWDAEKCGIGAQIKDDVVFAKACTRPYAKRPTYGESWVLGKTGIASGQASWLLRLGNDGGEVFRVGVARDDFNREGAGILDGEDSAGIWFIQNREVYEEGKAKLFDGTPHIKESVFGSGNDDVICYIDRVAGTFEVGFLGNGGNRSPYRVEALPPEGTVLYPAVAILNKAQAFQILDIEAETARKIVEEQEAAEAEAARKAEEERKATEAEAARRAEEERLAMVAATQKAEQQAAEAYFAQLDEEERQALESKAANPAAEDQLSVGALGFKFCSTQGAFAAVKPDGSVLTWGLYAGDNDIASRKDDLAIGVVSISTTLHAFAALRDDGSVVTWGEKTHGGEPHVIDDYGRSVTDVSRSLSRGVKAVYSTERAFAALKVDGSVVTWGRNEYGGNKEAVKWELMDAVRTIYATRHAFAALKNNGSVITWGGAGEGFQKEPILQTPSKRSCTPKTDEGDLIWDVQNQGGNSEKVQENIASGVKMIYATWSAFAAVKFDGSVVTWGVAGSGGNSADVKDHLAGGVEHIYSTAGAFAAMKSDGSLISWGGVDDSERVQESAASDIKAIYSNRSAFVALKKDGSIFTWGRSLQGSDVVRELQDVVSVCSTEGAFAALTASGAVVCWGSNMQDDPKSSLRELYKYPPKEELGSGVEKLFANQYAYAAVKTGGSVVTWGKRNFGGDSRAVSKLLATGVVRIESTLLAFAALKLDGSIVVWGDTGNGGNCREEDDINARPGIKLGPAPEGGLAMAKAGITSESVKEVFRKFDQSGDGTISFGEMRRLLQLLSDEFTDDRLMEMMHSADLNGDGVLQFDEFVEWLFAEGEERKALRAHFMPGKMRSCPVKKVCYMTRVQSAYDGPLDWDVYRVQRGQCMDGSFGTSDLREPYGVFANPSLLEGGCPERRQTTLGKVADEINCFTFVQDAVREALQEVIALNIESVGPHAKADFWFSVVAQGGRTTKQAVWYFPDNDGAVLLISDEQDTSYQENLDGPRGEAARAEKECCTM